VSQRDAGHGGLKEVLFAVSRGLGGFALARALNRRHVLILTYHGVLTKVAEADRYLSRNFVRVSDFHAQMDLLVHHYRALPLAEVVERRRAGKPLPERTACVTFDDGFQNNLTCAAPVLRLFGIPATIFVTTGYVGRDSELLWTERISFGMMHTEHRRIPLPDGSTLPCSSPEERAANARALTSRLKRMPIEERDRWLQALNPFLDDSHFGSEALAERFQFVTWDEMRAADPDWIEWGSHTVTHPILATLPPEDARREIEASKRTIEEQLDRSCRLFAYPNGTRHDFGDRECEWVAEAGYLAAVSQISGLNGPGANLYELRRVNIGLGHGTLAFEAHTSGLAPALRSLRGRSE
jgi:peptidoglycan/xylan/chitin deacetylase (PgdA/CDA1 family)